ncbi:MAG: GNAT family N-acetyltransferase [Oscillospiraceae bacterium]|nr:GNAT family N-acetyltransferase [Oscillospiraceae bacterium]
MQIRKATIVDMDLLIKLRSDFLLSDVEGYSVQEVEVIREKNRSYFEKWIPSGNLLVFVAEDNDETCSTAFLSIVERPPRNADTSNLVGTVYNVYTYPQYRRKGIATKVMAALLDEAKVLGVASVDLLATDDGKPLYEKLGFQIPNYTTMRIKFD